MSVSKKLVSLALAVVVVVGAGVFAPVANGQTTSDLQAQIAALLAQINALQAQLATGGTSGSSYNFTRDLTVGSTGDDVKALQQFLNGHGAMVSGSGAGSPGNESSYFGSLTKAALAQWQGSNGILPSVGYFGPKTRAYINSMSVGGGTTPGTGTYPAGCTSSVGYSSTTGLPCGTGTTVPAGVTVSLSNDNPSAANFAVGTSQLVPVLSLNFSAGSSPITVTGLNVTRSGLSADQDLNTVYLMDGANVVATNLGLSNGVINFSNASGLFTVSANSVKNIKVAISTASAASGHTFVFSVASAASITGATFGGTFPIMGNTMTGATVTNLGGLQITNSSVGITSGSGLSVNAGQTNFMVGQFTVQAQNQAVQVRSLKLTSTGSVNPTDLANIKLYNGGTQVGTTASLSGNTVWFDLSGSPLQLTAGQTAVFYVYADVVGGVNRYFQFSVQRNYDIVAQDMMFNLGVLPTLNTGFFPMNMSYINVLAGTLTVNRSASSPSTYILPGGTNQKVASFDLKAAGEAVRITALTVTLTGTSTVTNMKVVDDAGQQIGTTQSNMDTGTVTFSSLNYIIPANTTRVVTVYYDLGTTATGNYSAAISNLVGEGFVSLSAASFAGSQSGNTLSASSNLLTVSQNSGVGTIKVVAGTNAVKIASFNFVAGPSSGVQISNLSLVANTSSSLAFQNLKVMNGTTQIGQTQSTLADGTTYNFTASSPLTITAGQQLTFDVYADAKTGITTSTFGGTSGAVAVNIPTSGVSATAVSTNQALTSASISGLAANGQLVQVASAGVLTFAASNMPQAAQIGMGVTGVQLASYRIAGSSNEDVLLKDVVLKATSTNYSMFTNYRLTLDGASINDAQGNPLKLNTDASGNVTFYGVNKTIAQNTNPTLVVVADTNTWNNLQPAGFETATDNGSSTVAVAALNYQGIASSASGVAAGSAAGNLMNVLRTTLTPVTAAGVTYTSGVSDGAVVGAFTFTAGSSDDAFLASTTIQHVYAGATTTNVNTVFNVYDGALLVGTGTASTTSASSIVINLTAVNANGVTITKGTSKTLTVKADLTTAGFSRVTAGSPISYQIKLSAANWGDGTRLNLGLDSSIPNQPIVGSANSLQL